MELQENQRWLAVWRDGSVRHLVHVVARIGLSPPGGFAGLLSPASTILLRVLSPPANGLVLDKPAPGRAGGRLLSWPDRRDGRTQRQGSLALADSGPGQAAAAGRHMRRRHTGPFR